MSRQLCGQVVKWLWVVVIGVGLTWVWAVSLKGEEVPQGRGREEVELLVRRAEELKAAGQFEEANRLLRRAEELRLRTERPGGEARSGEGREVRILEEGLRRELAELRARLKELEEAGKNEEAVELRRRIRGMEEQLERLVRRPDFERDRGPEPREVRPWPGEMPRAQERIEPEQRMRLVRQAIDNLRLAGLPEIAERVAEEAKRWEREQRGGLGGEERASLPSAEMER
ncbi:MAG: hypothetical protein N2255_07025, partial [Kiritimatiellae bacterium]|nr:hypothetical protein [Kiritimatiellia bacterium]